MESIKALNRAKLLEGLPDTEEFIDQFGHLHTLIDKIDLAEKEYDDYKTSYKNGTLVINGTVLTKSSSDDAVFNYFSRDYTKTLNRLKEEFTEKLNELEPEQFLYFLSDELGGSVEKYIYLKRDYDKLKSDHDKLKSDYDKLKSDYDKLKFEQFKEEN